MNKLASRFVLLGLALGAMTLMPVAFAQDSASATSGSSSSSAPQHAAPDPQKQAARLTRRLGLSSDQSAKITGILQDRQQQLAAARSDNTLSPQDRRAKVRSIQQSTDSQINALLTPAQQTQYATIKQNMKNRWQSKHASPASSSSSSSGGSNSDSN
jgi:periplasmic protein CpxP/Spy